jgi:hypothetical protein
MKKLSGQVSIEYAAVLAAMLFVLILIVIVMGGIYAQELLRSNQMEAQHAVTMIAASAQECYNQGEGSQIFVRTKIPGVARMNKSFFTNNTFSLYVDGFGDVSQRVGFDIDGYWPNSTGIHTMSIENNGSYVLIRPHGNLLLSHRSLYINTTTLSASSHEFTIYNRGTANYSVFQNLSFSSTSYNRSGTYSLNSGESLRGKITVAPLHISKSFSGYLDIVATPQGTTDYYVEHYVIPITVSAE